MSVTRIEGARPLEAAPTHAKPELRAGGEPPKTEAPKKKEAPPLADSEPAPSNFKPYSLSFRFEKELNRVVVKVIDPETGELVREIPPESVIEALKQLRHAPGSLVDEEA